MLSPIGSHLQERLDKLISSKVLTRKKTKASSNHLIEEVKCRAGWLKIQNVKPKHWKNHKCIKWLEENKLNMSELVYVNAKIDSYLKEKENDQVEIQQQQTVNEILTKHNRQKLRLYHAIFHDKLRTQLLNLYVSKDRSQLDARNTIAAGPDFFEQACNLYNDPTWSPHTYLFPDFDSRFRTPIPLPLEKDNNDIIELKTAETVKKDFNNARADYKKVYARWKTNGNGSGNKPKQIRGTNYENGIFGEEEDVENVEDDRAKFCQQVGIQIGYFWCISEMCGVCQHMTQDCSGVGLSSTSNFVSLKDRFKMHQQQKRNRMS